MLERVLFQTLAPLLDRLGKGWKTIAGLTAMVVIAVLLQTGQVNSELGDDLWHYAEILFGVGVVHRQASLKK